MEFMQKKIPTEKTVRVLYILELKDELMNKEATNADLRDISFFEDEVEILLFPFSIYEISYIKKQDNYYIIYLNILGKYKQNEEFKNFKKQSDLIELINQSNYIKMLQKKDLLPMVLDLKKIVLHFVSINERINFYLVCNTHDNFLTILAKIYEEYPELREEYLIFLANGNKIKIGKTLKENNIKDGTTIVICVIDE